MPEGAERLREHDVTLSDGRVTLRPLTEEDWETLLLWEDDPDVLYYSEGDEVTGQSVEQLQSIYRPLSHHAFCFLIEEAGAAIGDCWLQEMNLDRILGVEPGLDCRRIDLALARGSWGRGAGSAAVRLLLEFGFVEERADAIFACDVGDYNERSLRMWPALGFEPHGEVVQPPGEKARICYDFVYRREAYGARAE